MFAFEKKINKTKFPPTIQRLTFNIGVRSDLANAAALLLRRSVCNMPWRDPPTAYETWRDETRRDKTRRDPALAETALANSWFASEQLISPDESRVRFSLHNTLFSSVFSWLQLLSVFAGIIFFYLTYAMI